MDPSVVQHVLRLLLVVGELPPLGCRTDFARRSRSQRPAHKSRKRSPSRSDGASWGGWWVGEEEERGQSPPKKRHPTTKLCSVAASSAHRATASRASHSATVKEPGASHKEEM